MSDAGIFINDSKVIIPDVTACNGIIHAIDAVLMPPAPPRTKCMFAISEASAIVQSGLGGDAEVRCSSQRMASSLVSSASGCSEEEAKAFAPDPLCIGIDGILPISAPVAENDSGSIVLNGDLLQTISIDVLANDISGDGGEELTLDITAVTTQPDNGRCEIITDHFGNQVIEYTTRNPRKIGTDSVAGGIDTEAVFEPNFTGTATCKYEVCYVERPELCDIAKVDIHIAAPSVSIYTYMNVD